MFTNFKDRRSAKQLMVAAAHDEHSITAANLKVDKRWAKPVTLLDKWWLVMMMNMKHNDGGKNLKKEKLKREELKTMI